MIDLIGGNPWDKEGFGPAKPATFSRFLLPFSYKLEKRDCIQQVDWKKALHFENFAADRFEPARSRYFTSETATVLYGRAAWARIPGEVWHGNHDRCGAFTFWADKSNHCMKIKIAPPWIVLFEGQKNDEKHHELLQQGFLIIETNLETDDGNLLLDDLLEFNELFRYMDNPYPKHADGFVKALADFPSDYRSGKKIKDTDPSSYFAMYKNRWLSLLELPLRKNGHIYSLIPDGALEREKRNVHSGHLSCDNNKSIIYADHRTFVWTCAILEGGAFALQKRYQQKVSEPWTSGHWLRLLNVDQPLDTPNKTHTNVKLFEQEWLRERTYKRWTEDGTYYGYCYHSGAMLGPPVENPPLWYHFGQIYFDQILLLFYLRITLFAFSRDLTHINEHNDEKRLVKEFKRLRCSFAKFTNLYQFPLISNQQQGVEMYEIARKSMDIDDLFRDVRDEVTSTHEYLEMDASAKLGKKANYLGLIGIIIALFSLPAWLASPINDFLKNGFEPGLLLIDALLILIAVWLFRHGIAKWFWRCIDSIWEKIRP